MGVEELSLTLCPGVELRPPSKVCRSLLKMTSFLILTKISTMLSNISQLSSMPLFYLTLTGTGEILAHKRENLVKWFLVIFSRREKRKKKICSLTSQSVELNYQKSSEDLCWLEEPEADVVEQSIHFSFNSCWN